MVTDNLYSYVSHGYTKQKKNKHKNKNKLLNLNKKLEKNMLYDKK